MKRRYWFLVLLFMLLLVQESYGQCGYGGCYNRGYSSGGYYGNYYPVYGYTPTYSHYPAQVYNSYSYSQPATIMRSQSTTAHCSRSRASTMTERYSEPVREEVTVTETIVQPVVTAPAVVAVAPPARRVRYPWETRANMRRRERYTGRLYSPLP